MSSVSPYAYEWLETVGLGVYVCPECAGGASSERSCNIFYHAGRRFAKCHRASCGAIWSVGGYQRSGLGQIAAPGASPEVLRPYTEDRRPLPADMARHLADKYGFIPPGTQMGGRYEPSYDKQRYLVPILAPSGSERGVMEMLLGSNKYRKIWKAKAEPMISWTPEADYYDGVYLVEDQISALKLHHVASIRAIALLGISLNAESVAEIQRNARHVTIALDADATAKAFLLARKWGSAFKSCEVCVLTQDIKDMSFKDIQGLMHDRGHLPTSSGGEF